MACSKMVAPVFDECAGIDERVDILAPLITRWIEDWENGINKQGAETFQGNLINIMIETAMIVYRWVCVSKVGAHPANREWAMLVPADVHDLLVRIANKGWCWFKVDVLAFEIPPNDEGNSWRLANVQLAQGSDGLIPRYSPDELEIVTVRGSHTTAAVRCYMFGSKGIHEELCLNGIVSKSRILERQPSMHDEGTQLHSGSLAVGDQGQTPHGDTFPHRERRAWGRSRPDDAARVQSCPQHRSSHDASWQSIGC